MTKSSKLSPLAAAVSAAFLATAMGTSAQAAENPFATAELNAGDQLAASHKEDKMEGEHDKKMEGDHDKDMEGDHDKGMEGDHDKEMESDMEGDHDEEE